VSSIEHEQPSKLLAMARMSAAVAILATGAIHFQQLIVEDFQGLHTLWVLFILNVVGSGIVGLCLLAPLDRLLPDEWADSAVALLAAVGLTIAVGSLVSLFVAETGSLFGLSSRHYSTPAVLAIVAEGAAVLLLTPVLASSGRRALLRGWIANSGNGR
jgi:hypothetical protein